MSFGTVDEILQPSTCVKIDVIFIKSLLVTQCSLAEETHGSVDGMEQKNDKKKKLVYEETDDKDEKIDKPSLFEVNKARKESLDDEFEMK